MRAVFSSLMAVLLFGGLYTSPAQATGAAIKAALSLGASEGTGAAPAQAKRGARKSVKARGKAKAVAQPKQATDQAQPGAPELPAKAGTPPAPPPPPNVTLRALAAAERPPLQAGLGWRVLERPGAPVREEKIVWSGGGAEPRIYLAPGRYYVEATFGFAKTGQEIEVAPDRSAESTLLLNAGTIRARGIAAPGKPALSDMFYILRRTNEAGMAAGEIGRSSLSQAIFHVPAGRYSLAMQHGLAKSEIPVTVIAGQETVAEGVMNAGEVRISAAATSEGPLLDDAVFFVYVLESGGALREVARSELREAAFSLPAGRYRIVAVYGLARAERVIDVKAGVSSEEKLVMNAGAVKLSSILANDMKPMDRGVIYRVFAVSGEQNGSSQAIATSAKPEAVFHLKSGKYRIESQYGWHNARQVREVDVVPGETTQIAFEHRACEVKLKLAAAAGTPALGRVKWTLRYANGGTVLISQDSAPSLIVQAGSYQVMAQHGTKTYTRAFEAAPNEVHTIELVTE